MIAAALATKEDHPFRVSSNLGVAPVKAGGIDAGVCFFRELLRFLDTYRIEFTLIIECRNIICALAPPTTLWTNPSHPLFDFLTSGDIIVAHAPSLRFRGCAGTRCWNACLFGAFHPSKILDEFSIVVGTGLLKHFSFICPCTILKETPGSFDHCNPLEEQVARSIEPCTLKAKLKLLLTLEQVDMVIRNAGTQWRLAVLAICRKCDCEYDEEQRRR